MTNRLVGRSFSGALLLSICLLVGTLVAFAQTSLADGQVVKIDQAAGKITIKHGPLKQFGMDESMTMACVAGSLAISAGFSLRVAFGS
jgi:Cu/Ag efflux protein CusF